MGKQINYWLGYQDFLKLAQVALDNNCVILKTVNREVLIGNSLDFINGDTVYYYFLPLETNFEQNADLDLLMLRQKCQVIEAGYSYIDHKEKEIIGERIYVGTGYYDEQGEYIYRGEKITKIYNRLVRAVKKLAPYTELTDSYISTHDRDYLQEIEYKHKEYVSPECLSLRESKNYKLRI